MIKFPLERSTLSVYSLELCKVQVIHLILTFINVLNQECLKPSNLTLLRVKERQQWSRHKLGWWKRSQKTLPEIGTDYSYTTLTSILIRLNLSILWCLILHTALGVQSNAKTSVMQEKTTCKTLWNSGLICCTCVKGGKWKNCPQKLS